MPNSVRFTVAVAIVRLYAALSHAAGEREPDVNAMAAATCESLAAKSLANGHIDSAAVVAAGSFRPPDGRGSTPAYAASLPAFCRVAATLTPTNDSDIKIEVWMPVSNWN